ncbi:MAG: spore cortex biosynthesis protein YabQ [Clostridia bacterium]
MLYYTVGQWRIFVVLMGAGVLAGAWYGVVNRAARLLSAGPLIYALCDLVTALGAWLIVALALLASCYGEMRAYALVGAICGFALERLTMGRLVDWLAHRLGRLFKWVSGQALFKEIFR